MSSPARVVIAGGGAAGFFAAIACIETNPSAEVLLVEATAHPLAKVRVSGGGRCNVTHACFEPRDLVKRYPRGGRELLGAFHRFQPRDTVAWFAAHGVELKTEADGRMFPVTDTSETIVNCLLGVAARAGVKLRTRSSLASVERRPGGGFHVGLVGGESLACDRLLLATGGTRGSAGHTLAQALGHTIEPLAPSLFTFNVSDDRIRGLAGISVADAVVSVPLTKRSERGPVLVTHWGLSGPAILRLSAWGARELQGLEYRFPLAVNWCGGASLEAVRADLAQVRGQHARRQVGNTPVRGVPQRLWERLVAAAGLAVETPWTSVSNAGMNALAVQLTAGEFPVDGKSTNKEEFVTCGGVKLAEVDFRTLESRVCPGLHFAGEVLDIDGITGGFNFQAAWTTGHLAGVAMAQSSG